MKKILYLVSTLKKTGPIVVVANIIKYLDRSKFEPVILTLSPEPSDSMLPFFRDELSVYIDSFGLSRGQFYFKGKSKLKQYISEHDIDIVHSHGLRADQVVAKLNICNVSTLHNYPYYDYPAKFGKIKSWLMVRSHMQAILRNNNNCISCSKSISHEYKKNNLDLPCIQNGVDIEIFKPLSTTSKKISRDKLGLNINKKIFITVGSLIPRKNVETVIKGFNLFNKNNNAFLLIVGDGFERNNLEYLQNDNITFVGNVSNVVEYLQASDVFISASLAEGLPNTVLEAMSCGLPVVLSNIPSHLELFEKQGGFFFPPKDDIELASKLINLDDEEACNRSVEMINKCFSAEMMSKKYQVVYAEKISE